MKIFVAIALVAIGFNVHAAKPLLVWCQGCSAIQRQDLARKQGAGNTVYVGDTVNKSVTAFDVYIDVEDTVPVTRKKVADEIAPNQQLVSAIDSGIAYYNTIPVGWHKRLHANADDYSSSLQSVYDVIDAGPRQNQLLDWLNGGSSWSTDAYLLTGWVRTGFAMFHLVDLSAAPTLGGTIHFADGSQVDGYYDNVTGKIKIDPDSARDSHHNSVPYLGSDGRIHNLGGQHEFDATTGNPADIQNFLDQLSLLHVPIIVGGDSAPHHGWACTKSGEGPDAVYTCQQT
jgi:hypothetical protein